MEEKNRGHKVGGWIKTIFGKKLFFGVFLLFFLSSCLASTQSEYYYLMDLSNPRFLPETIYSGDVVSMALDITNRGGTYSIIDITPVIDFGPQFELISTDVNLLLIGPGLKKTMIITFRVNENTLPGYYPIIINFGYSRDGFPFYDDSSERKEKFEVIIPVSKKETSLDISVNPSVINPSVPTNVDFYLKNVGGTPISSISFSWSESSNLILPVGSDNKRFVSYIAPGETAKVSYVIAADPNIVTGIYSINAIVSFLDQNGTNSQSSNLGLIIGGTTDFDISAENNGGTISISIANIGSNNAGAVIAKLFNQTGSSDGSNTVILGNLNKGDYTIASFTLPTTTQSNFSVARTEGQVGQRGQREFDSDNPSSSQNTQRDFNVDNMHRENISNNLKLQIEYTDTTGKRQVVEKDIFLNQSNQMDSNIFSARSVARTKQNQDFLIPLVLLSLIFASVIVFNYKKAKKDWKRVEIILAGILILFLVTIFFFNLGIIELILATIISIIILFLFFKTNKFEKIFLKLGVVEKKK